MKSAGPPIFSGRMWQPTQSTWLRNMGSGMSGTPRPPTPRYISLMPACFEVWQISQENSSGSVVVRTACLISEWHWKHSTLWLVTWFRWRNSTSSRRSRRSCSPWQVTHVCWLTVPSPVTASRWHLVQATWRPTNPEWLN